MTDALMIRLLAPTRTGKKKPSYELSKLLATHRGVVARRLQTISMI